jgi:hypothetical protein
VGAIRELTDGQFLERFAGEEAEFAWEECTWTSAAATARRRGERSS